MEAFPAYFPLKGRRVVIAGEGPGADAKARLFEGAPAQVVRASGPPALEPSLYEGAVLAFVASDDADFRARAAAAARAAHVPVNVTDQPAMSDFYTPALIDRGQVVAAIGTDGASPMLASMLRADIEARVPEGAGRAAALLKRHQDAVRSAFPEAHDRRTFLRAALEGEAVAAALAGDTDKADQLFLAALKDGASGLGAVRVIDGRGPAEDLTLKAARFLASADVLVVAEGCDARVVELARRDADRITATPVEQAALAGKGLNVVVLAAGDGRSERDAAGPRAELVYSRPAP